MAGDLTRDPRGFNPDDTENINVLQNVKLPQGIQQPRLVNPSAVVLEGLGNVASDTAKASVQVAQAAIEHGIRSEVEPVRQRAISEFEEALKGFQGKDPRRVTTTGTPIGPAVGGEALPPTDDASFKKAITDAFGAKKSGKFSLSYIDGLYDTILSDYRARWGPGFADYIDKVFEKITGEIPANARLKHLLGDINSYMTGHDAERNSWINKIYGLSPEYDDKKAGWIAYIRAGGDLNAVIPQVIKADHERAVMEYSKLQRDTIAGNRKEAADKAEDELTVYAQNRFADESKVIKPLETYAANSKQAEIDAAEIQRRRTVMEANFKNWAISQGVYKALGPERYELVKNNLLQFYDRMSGWLTNKETGPAFLSANITRGMADDYKFQAWNDPKAGDYLRWIDFVNKNGGSEANKIILEEMAKTPNLAEDVRGLMTRIHVRVAAGDLSIPDAAALLKAKGVKDPEAYNTLVTVPINGILNPNIKDDEKRIYAKFFSPENWGYIARLEKERIGPEGTAKGGNWSMYIRLSDPDMIDAMKKLGGQEWDNYRNWMKNAFGHELMKPSLMDLKDIEIPSDYTFGWNDEHHRFEVKDKLGRDALEPGRMVGSIRGAPLSPNARSTLTNINSSLSRLSYLARQEGANPKDVDDILFHYMTDLGSDLNVGKRNMPNGIPERMMNSLLANQAAAQKQKAEAEAAAKAERKKFTRPE